MDIAYTYTKLRKNFGRQPMFSMVPVQMLDSISPNVSQQKQFILRNPVNKDIQVSSPQSECHINTKRVIMQDQGANHAEGGWPRDINFADEEQTSRYRRRIERDDNYVDAVLHLSSKFDHYIKQNNAVNLYQMYFKSMPPQEPIEKSSIRVNNIYKDPESRPISSIGWTQEDDPKLVVSYCDKRFPITGPLNPQTMCYVWDLENCNFPCDEFLPASACWQISCSPVRPSIILGGLADGTVCVFDTRHKTSPVAVSPMHLAHRDPVTALLYIHSRTNTEFFSGSTDGQCKWWDIRNISYPIDSLIMSVRIPQGEQISMANAEGVSTLQFDRSFPTRFLCGTDTGLVINVNRKGKTPHEIMSGVFYAHLGPVRAVHRSPCTSKMFITCGDWTAKIWSDDVQISPIISGTGQRYQVMDVAWAPQRFSSYMSVSADGKFRFWDLLRKYREPVMVLRVSSHALLKLKPHEFGKLIAIGDAKGAVHLLSLSHNLVVSKNKDKQLMNQTYERESRREHILETRVKEIRLKLKTEEEAGAVEPVVDEEALVRAAEEEYRKIVYDEIRRVGYTPSPAAKPEMRKR